MPKPPPEEPEEPPRQLSEGEQLHADINRVTDDSLNSTRRMMTLCSDAKDMGIKTLVALDDQGEKLDNIEKGMRDIYEDMVEAEAAIAGMNAPCWGLCVPCTPRPNESELFTKGCDGGGGGERPTELSNEGVPQYGGYIAKYTNNKEEDEMEENMEQVSNMIGNLRNMAIDMGSGITTQNAQLDRINLMADENTGRLEKANEQARKML
jgi:synaptosomal-associated protein 25